jgi:hypothetical protein
MNNRFRMGFVVVIMVTGVLSVLNAAGSSEIFARRVTVEDVTENPWKLEGDHLLLSGVVRESFVIQLPVRTAGSAAQELCVARVVDEEHPNRFVILISKEELPGHQSARISGTVVMLIPEQARQRAAEGTAALSEYLRAEGMIPADITLDGPVLSALLAALSRVSDQLYVFVAAS